ncbi:hypothetical protein E8E13_003843 [Curvularia kusanoi]|uniref:Uncharacterized protein n=1 Tax=Curvularia kusanoi TaxID=90978 RepID=A0A9P4TCJ8_CURKU|nr:hypothetical protein E8E13_003843 [Curvularia kusanoi]
MTRDRRFSHKSHSHLDEGSQHRNDGQRHESTSHHDSTSMQAPNTVQTSPYWYRSQRTNEQYAQHVDPSYHSSHSATQYYPYYSESNTYVETPRTWANVNPNVTDLLSNPAMKFNPTTSPSATNYNSTYYSNQSAPSEGQNQLTVARLEAFNTVSPPTDGRRRYEQQGQRAGPYDGVGYVGRNSN